MATFAIPATAPIGEPAIAGSPFLGVPVSGSRPLSPKVRGRPSTGPPIHPDAESAFMEELQNLWAETLGDPGVIIAILDGPVDLTHPSLKAASLAHVETLVSGATDRGPAGQHGTHIASVIFGQHDGPVKGIAPACRGLVIPIFESADASRIRPCSQLTLAFAMTQAVQNGAQIINISGGQFLPSGEGHPLLATALGQCIRSGVLIVAAVGNDGCACPHVPAAMESVLAVGAMNARGEPLAFSNWGGRYQVQGILALGENILGAKPGGGTIRRSGTSYATAVVSGIAALLLSRQRKRGQAADPPRIRQAILASALGCDYQAITDCHRLLAGRLNVKGASSLITQEICTMSESVAAPSVASSANQGNGDVESAVGGLAASATPPPSQPEKTTAVAPGDVQASACACPGAGGATQLVYALGQLGYDLVSEARLDSLVQKMGAVLEVSHPDRQLAFDRRQMLTYLDRNPWDAAAIEWTLNVDGTPVHAIRPQGPFASDTYKELRRFLKEQLDEGAERISVPGLVGGKTTLLLGQVVPMIIPELRGMYSWTTSALVEKVVGPAPPARAGDQRREEHERKKAGVRNFLDRVYHQVRNLGLLPQDRALNLAATNAFQIGEVFESALKENMELDTINVVRSPICRPGSDCWEVEVYFFYPERQVQTVRKVHRFTVDTSDVVPVTVGPTRCWFTR